MTDRDRLAADLHDVSMEAYGQRRWAQAPWPTDLYDFVADRLIALGWGLVDDLECLECGGRATRRPIALDEERLARALCRGKHGPGDFDNPLAGCRGTHRRKAAAIAKAYREDTDA